MRQRDISLSVAVVAVAFAVASCGGPAVPSAEPPGEPANVTAAPAADHVLVSWDAASGSVDGYIVFREALAGAAATAALQEIGRVGPTTLSYQDRALAAGTTYRYAVAAHNGAGVSTRAPQTNAPVPWRVARHALTVLVRGSGTVASTPAGILCPSDCREELPAGSRLTLRATPAAGQAFVGWSGDCQGAAATCEVALDGPRGVVAEFAPQGTMHTITVLEEGAGEGTVVSSPAGIDCGADCSETFQDGTEVGLTATARPGSRFAGWGGACSGTAPTCAVTVRADVTVSARFERDEGTAPPPGAAALTIVFLGEGAGAVTADGERCEATCTIYFPVGSRVQLEAIKPTESAWEGWSGDCSGIEFTCSVTLDKDREVRAGFTPSYLLEVEVSGPGRVVSTFGGIACPSDCRTRGRDRAITVLTAIPDEGATFLGWAGACSGEEGDVCTVELSGDRKVRANFLAQSNRPPIAAVSVSVPVGRSPHRVLLSGASSNDPDGTIVAYRWRIEENGSIEDLEGAEVDFTFNSVGTHRVTLTVEDDDGNLAEASSTVEVDWRLLGRAKVAGENQGSVFKAVPWQGGAALLTVEFNADCDDPVRAYRWVRGTIELKNIGTTSVGPMCGSVVDFVSSPDGNLYRLLSGDVRHSLDRYSNGAWERVSLGAIDPAESGLSLNLGLLPDSTPLVVRDDGKVFELRGDEWKEHSTIPFPVLGGMDVHPTALGDIYLYWKDNDFREKSTTLAVAKWDGTTWSLFQEIRDAMYLGPTAVAYAPPRDAGADAIPVVAFVSKEENGRKVVVQRFLNGTWRSFGSIDVSSDTGVRDIALAVDSEGTVYLSYLSDKIRLLTWRGEEWSAIHGVIDRNTTSLYNDHSLLVVAGRPIIAWSLEGEGKPIRMASYVP